MQPEPHETPPGSQDEPTLSPASLAADDSSQHEDQASDNESEIASTTASPEAPARPPSRVPTEAASGKSSRRSRRSSRRTASVKSVSRAAGEDDKASVKSAAVVIDDEKASIKSGESGEGVVVIEEEPAGEEKPEEDKKSVKAEGEAEGVPELKHVSIDVAPDTSDDAESGWAAVARSIREVDEQKIQDYKEDIDTILVFVRFIVSPRVFMNID